MLNVLLAVCTGLPESVTFAVKPYVPLVVGVPEITPVEGLSESPGGKAPDEIDQVYGVVPPLAARVREYETPTLPLGSDEVVIVRGGICTVRVVPPVIPLKAAEMVLEPAATPVASPAMLIVATAVFEDDQVTWLVMFCVLPFE